MPTEVDNIELDTTNEEFNQAADFVRSTNNIFFLTGKAGTGKTTFLKYIKSQTKKNSVILAPTGVAAINAGGVTINSFFQIPFGPFVPNDKRLRTSKDLEDLDSTTIYSTFKYREEKKNIIEGLELLIIDEISMVRCDTLDIIDKLLRVFRKKTFLPFGGVQVILIGDTFQLPPIANERNNEWQILSQFYESRFFFSSKIMSSLIAEKKYSHFELKKIYRQEEQEFIDLLNRIRVNQVINSDIQLLDNKHNPTFTPNDTENYIILSTHNFQVDQTNKTKLDELKTELKTYEGELKGEFPKDFQGNYVLPTELNLQLKEGAQVMFLKNDTGEFKKYFNGKIGKVKSLNEKTIIIEFSDGTKVPVEKASWNHIEYIWNKEKKKVEEKIKGTFTQYPIRLAWAITVHKSQGLTFEKVIADLGAAFEDGQVYVALSRCTTLTGLHLKTKIPKGAIKASLNAIEFAKNETPGTLITKQLNEGKADFYYKKVRQDIYSLNFLNAFENFTNAIKFRNDIETESFKKYFVVTASRLGSLKPKLSNSLKQLEEVTHKNISLKKNIATLETEKDSQQIELNDRNITIELLFDKTNELEKQNEKQKSHITTLTTEKAISEKTILQYQKTVQGNNTTISKLETTVKNNEREIERLTNLKWYQKLFGQK